MFTIREEIHFTSTLPNVHIWHG